MFTSFLLLLLAAVSCIDCQVVLTQSEQSVVVAPGIDCQVVLTQSEQSEVVAPDVSGISLSSSPAQTKAPGQSFYGDDGNVTVWSSADDYVSC
ncbi:hypothetical protein G5714_003512 [Onychostoma macrolepis]|uniref:Secreted protein n=1 Tax=Onychostoma macrolepis TaxID=369639 RepID=A0A7J6D9Q2_9TELE|nr:hypothetical protein G5714_003512 [Onychostoma macrolepis]